MKKGKTACAPLVATRGVEVIFATSTPQLVISPTGGGGVSCLCLSACAECNHARLHACMHEARCIFFRLMLSFYFLFFLQESPQLYSSANDNTENSLERKKKLECRSWRPSLSSECTDGARLPPLRRQSRVNPC